MSVQDEFAGAVLDPTRGVPDGVKTSNGSDPADRFAVYRNNVVASLINALADTFPVTRDLVGDEFFRAMARLFVARMPPHDARLTFYGEKFPDFIAGFAPAASVPYLADVARLEMLYVEAYHSRDALPLDAARLAGLLSDAEALPHVVLGLHPSVRIMRSPHAIVSLWAAHQGAGDFATISSDNPENALIARPHLDVMVRQIDQATFDFIAELLAGANLGVAATGAGRNNPEFDLMVLFMQMIEGQLISSITTA